MGIFDKMFKGSDDFAKKEMKEVPWNLLHSESDLNQLEDESENKVVVIFKHSTSCGVSRMVLKQFESEYDYNEEEVKLYFLDLLKYRSVSNKVAEDFGVYHESPQMLIIKNRNVVYHTSHSDISAGKIQEYIS